MKNMHDQSKIEGASEKVIAVCVDYGFALNRLASDKGTGLPCRLHLRSRTHSPLTPRDLLWPNRVQALKEQGMHHKYACNKRKT